METIDKITTDNQAELQASNQPGGRSMQGQIDAEFRAAVATITLGDFTPPMIAEHPAIAEYRQRWNLPAK